MGSATIKSYMVSKAFKMNEYISGFRLVLYVSEESLKKQSRAPLLFKSGVEKDCQDCLESSLLYFIWAENICKSSKR